MSEFTLNLNTASLKAIYKILDIDSKFVGTEDYFCLLYTSDAADDLTRVDLGGRRII